MKILGIGVDIIENKRIKNSIKNDRFKERVYSSKELKQSTLSKDKIGYFSNDLRLRKLLQKQLGLEFLVMLISRELRYLEMIKANQYLTLIRGYKCA